MLVPSLVGREDPPCPTAWPKKNNFPDPESLTSEFYQTFQEGITKNLHNFFYNKKVERQLPTHFMRPAVLKNPDSKPSRETMDQHPSVYKCKYCLQNEQTVPRNT